DLQQCRSYAECTDCWALAQRQHAAEPAMQITSEANARNVHSPLAIARAQCPDVPQRPRQAALRRLLEEAFFGLLRDHTKRGRILHGEVGKHLAIDCKARRIHASDELAVGQAVKASVGVDARDPERPHGALLGLAIAISVLTGLDDGLLRNAIALATSVVIVLRLLEYFLVASAGDDASLNACHVSLLHFACGSN